MTHINDMQTVHTCQTRSVCKPRPQLIFEARLVFEARPLFEEIRYTRRRRQCAAGRTRSGSTLARPARPRRTEAVSTAAEKRRHPVACLEFGENGGPPTPSKIRFLSLY